MHERRLFAFLFLLSLVMSLVSVSAQTGTLTPNATRNNAHTWGFGSDSYSAQLEAGSWTVIVQSDSFWGMQFRVRVSLSSDMTDQLGEAEGAGDSGVSVQFNLESEDTVYIQLEEIGGGSGYYSIGVYDDFNAFTTQYGLILLIVIIAVIIIACIILGRRKASGITRSTSTGSFKLEAPSYVIPEKYRSEPATADLRTVRLPEKCPSCGGALLQEEINWTGPLQAECSYCGAAVRAKFEKV